MDLSEDLQDRLDQYISGTLSRQDALAFEQEMADNETLRHEFNLQKNLSLGIAHHGNQELKNKLEHIHDAVISPGTRVKKSHSIQWRYLAVAASISILLVSYFLFFGDNNKLYKQYYERPTFSIQRNGEEMTPLDQAGINFNQGNYKKAIEIFEVYLADNPDDHNAGFYLGIAYLDADQAEKAIQALKNVVDSKDPFFKDQSSWYLALAYLRNKETAAARLVLKSLSEDEGAGKWQQLASALLEDIK